MIDTMIVICLFCLTMGMFAIGYCIGHIEERHYNEFKRSDYIPSDSDIADVFMEMEQSRELEKRDLMVDDD